MPAATFGHMSDWHPWRHLAEVYPHIRVITRHQLPAGVMGVMDGGRIWLCASLNQAERRSTLDHELHHLDRGPVLVPHLVPREEAIVSELSARRLITLPGLVDALRWTRNAGELAEELWTDEPTVRCRMNTLTPIEVAELEHRLGDHWTQDIA